MYDTCTMTNRLGAAVGLRKAPHLWLRALLLLSVFGGYRGIEGSESREYISLGCWRDTSDRAIPTLEGTDPRLDGRNYLFRDNPIEKCYQVALSRGFPMFAVQASGWCAGSADGLNTYNKYGPSTTCASDGEGGPWGNEVYKITESSWSASSQFNNQTSADRADINTCETAYKAGAWAARTNDVGQWLMRDLGKVKVVTGIITKGRNYSPDWPHGPHDQYVTSYVISYGIENGDEQFYTNATNETIVFTGNQDRDTEVFNDFLAYSGSIEARFVKIHPRTWHEHISMRAKVVTFDVNCEMGEFGHLFFPGADGGDFSYSDERCNSSSANGKPLASRFCRIISGRGALWDNPVNLTCDINLQNLSQVEVNSESALSVATELQVITLQADTLSSNDVTSISTIVQDIVNASATEEIGDSLLTTVDSLIKVNATILQQSQQETRGPTRVVQALETFADTVVLTAEKYTVVRPRVALQAADISPEELDKGQGFAFFLGGNDSNTLTEGNVLSLTSKDESDFQQTADISILLPAGISNMIQISDSSEVRLSYTLYSSSSLFVQTSQGAVGTHIIGGRIAGRRVQKLPEPVIITFTPLQDILSEYAKEGRCVFWDFEAEAGQGAWSAEGCERLVEENGRYKCACNHLTNFAVLFNVHGGDFGDHEKPLEVITVVGCVVSIVCLILTLLSFVLTRKSKRGSRTGRHAKNQRLILINLCVALLAILVIFPVGVNKTASPIGCTAVAALLHYFLLAALVWMAVEAVSIYRAVVLVFDHHVSGNFVIKAAVVAWGFPLVATVLTAGPSSLYQYRMEKSCWLAQKPLIYAFLLPAGLILLFNLLVFVIVMYKLVRNEQGRKQLRASGDKPNEADRSWITRQIRRAFSIMALFGLTWVFGFFVITDASLVFAYLFCIFNTLQGLFIFVFHCAMREGMTKWWKKINCINGKSKRGRHQLAQGGTPFSPAAETPQTITLSIVSSYNGPQ
ncbi:adhesion G-protein coupled receptor G7-like [Branchiostoma floridae x Branchiostoma japonicum]